MDTARVHSETLAGGPFAVQLAVRLVMEISVIIPAPAMNSSSTSAV
jgi:hypothetical protein